MYSDVDWSGMKDDKQLCYLKFNIHVRGWSGNDMSNLNLRRYRREKNGNWFKNYCDKMELQDYTKG